MTPVDQIVFEDGKGDCFRACVASILDLPAAEVPNFVEALDFDAAVREWLSERGLRLFCFTVVNAVDLSFMYFREPTVCILAGKSPRNDAAGRRKRHAVVARAGGWGVDISHDPHPSRAGLLDSDREVWVITGRVRSGG